MKLSLEDSPKFGDEKVEMAQVPYSSVVGSLMYAMIATRPDIAFAMGVVSHYMSNPGRICTTQRICAYALEIKMKV